MRTLPQFKFAFLPGGANESTSGGSAEQVCQAFGFSGGEVCARPEFEFDFLPDGAEKRPRYGFAAKKKKLRAPSFFSRRNAPWVEM